MFLFQTKRQNQQQHRSQQQTQSCHTPTQSYLSTGNVSQWFKLQIDI